MVLKIGTFHILIVVEKTRYFLEIVKKKLSKNKIQMAEIRTPNIEFLKQTIARHGIRPHEF